MKIVFIIILISFSSPVFSQIPVELFFGNEKSTFDLMFFKYFKNSEGQNSEFLFFSRERVVLDNENYENASGVQFGFTEAISFNNHALFGIAPVLVIQITNNGMLPKFGIQYANVTSELTIFSWFVSEFKDNPKYDYFLLSRYTPNLATNIRLFTQLEILYSIFSNKFSINSATYRVRIGLKFDELQFGLGSDDIRNFSILNATYTNFGLFLRYEF